MDTPDTVARELLKHAGIEGFPGRLGRELLFELFPRLETRPHGGRKTWIVHVSERSVIMLPSHLRGQDREEALWHELPHAVCRFTGLGIWVPARNGAGSFRLKLQADAAHEAFAGRLERALRLPFPALWGLEDNEILAESGVSREMLALRRDDLR
jgi:hypothetical protein